MYFIHFSCFLLYISCRVVFHSTAMFSMLFITIVTSNKQLIRRSIDRSIDLSFYRSICRKIYLIPNPIYRVIFHDRIINQQMRCDSALVLTQWRDSTISIIIGSCTMCQNPDYFFGIAHSNYNTII